jgi:hypothetical protein
MATTGVIDFEILDPQDLKDFNKLLQRELYQVPSRAKTIVRKRVVPAVRFTLLCGYFILISVIQSVIVHSELLNTHQKVINSLFLWVISVLWICIIVYIVRPSKSNIAVENYNKLRRFQFWCN